MLSHYNMDFCAVAAKLLGKINDFVAGYPSGYSYDYSFAFENLFFHKNIEGILLYKASQWKLCSSSGNFPCLTSFAYCSKAFLISEPMSAYLFTNFGLN